MSNSTRLEKYALLTLSVMLVGVFVLSVTMYDSFSAESASGTFSVFAQNAREFVFENEAVATFLGIEEREEEHANIDVAKEAAEYICRYNEIFKDSE